MTTTERRIHARTEETLHGVLLVQGRRPSTYSQTEYDVAPRAAEAEIGWVRDGTGSPMASEAGMWSLV